MLKATLSLLTIMFVLPAEAQTCRPELACDESRITLPDDMTACDSSGKFKASFCRAIPRCTSQPYSFWLGQPSDEALAGACDALRDSHNNATTRALINSYALIPASLRPGAAPFFPLTPDAQYFQTVQSIENVNTCMGTQAIDFGADTSRGGLSSSASFMSSSLNSYGNCPFTGMPMDPATFSSMASLRDRMLDSIARESSAQASSVETQIRTSALAALKDEQGFLQRAAAFKMDQALCSNRGPGALGAFVRSYLGPVRESVITSEMARMRTVQLDPHCFASKQQMAQEGQRKINQLRELAEIPNPDGSLTRRAHSAYCVRQQAGYMALGNEDCTYAFEANFHPEHPFIKARFELMQSTLGMAMMSPPLDGVTKLSDSERTPFRQIRTNEATPIDKNYRSVPLPPSRYDSSGKRLPPPGTDMSNLLKLSSSFSSGDFGKAYDNFIKDQKSGAAKSLRPELQGKPLDFVPFMWNNYTDDKIREKTTTSMGQIFAQNPVSLAKMYANALGSEEYAMQLCNDDPRCNQDQVIRTLSTSVCSSLTEFDNLLDQMDSIQDALFYTSMIASVIPMGGMAASGASMLVRAMTGALFKKMAAKFGEVAFARAVAGAGGQIASAYRVAAGVANTTSTVSMLTYMAYSDTAIYQTKADQLTALKALAMSDDRNDSVMTEITRTSKEIHDLLMESTGNTAGMMVGVVSGLRVVRELGASNSTARAKLLEELRKLKANLLR